MKGFIILFSHIFVSIVFKIDMPSCNVFHKKTELSHDPTNEHNENYEVAKLIKNSSTIGLHH